MAIFLLSAVTASNITRDFSSSTVEAGQNVSVTISILINENQTYWALEEYVPLDWAVVDPMGGECNESTNILKWIYYNETMVAENVSYTYIVQSPLFNGSYEFDGVYIIEEMGSPENLTGERTILVTGGESPVESPTSTGGGFSLDDLPGNLSSKIPEINIPEAKSKLSNIDLKYYLYAAAGIFLIYLFMRKGKRRRRRR